MMVGESQPVYNMLYEVRRWQGTVQAEAEKKTREVLPQDTAYLEELAERVEQPRTALISYHFLLSLLR